MGRSEAGDRCLQLSYRENGNEGLDGYSGWYERQCLRVVNIEQR